MNRKYIYLIIIFLTVISFIAYGRILGNEFINFDDTSYITQNSHIQAGFTLENIKWALSSVQFYYWQPLTWFSHMLDWSLFKNNAGGHHLTSLLLHLGSVIFLFLFLYKTTTNIWPSAFAAAFFAIHPLRVESVAWAAERKDVLSMFLGMSCLYAYARYIENIKISRYIICLILFALSLTAKPSMVTLPFVFLLLDYWPLKRWQQFLPPVEARSASSQTTNDKKNKKYKATTIVEQKISLPLTCGSQTIHHLLWEKVPFILLTVVSSCLTFWGQKKFGVVASLEDIPLAARFQNMIVSYINYLWNTVWPSDLAIWYPLKLNIPFWQFLFSFVILIGISVTVIYTVKKLPFLFVGWFWYLGTLLPTIGLVQLTTQARADRFSYLPSIGFAIMLAWGIPQFFRQTEIRKKFLLPVAIVVLSVLTTLTWHQCVYWKNSFKIFSHCLEVTKNNSHAHLYLGLALAEKGKFNDAIVQFNKGLSITAIEFRILAARGNAFNALGQHNRAIEDFNEAIRIKPDFTEAYISRGKAYHSLSQYNLAIEDYNEAIRQKPEFTDAYYCRGETYSALGQYHLAINEFSEVIRRKPEAIIVYFNRANAYSEIGQYQQAINDYNEVIRQKPDFTEAYFNRGNAYVRGQYQHELAIKDYNETIRLKPDFTEAYTNRGGLLIQQGNKKTGCLDFKKACELGDCRILKVAISRGDCS